MIESSNQARDMHQEAESIKMAAIQAYVEKENLIMELTSKMEKLEGKVLFYEETQLDIQNEREEMQKKIIDLANMLDKDAEINDKRKKDLENEINMKVELKTMLNLKQFEENKVQMIQTMQFGIYFLLFV